MKYLDKINVREIILLFAVGMCCYFIGVSRGREFRDQDSIIIKLNAYNQKLIQIVNYAIKQDTTGTVKNAIEDGVTAAEK